MENLLEAINASSLFSITGTFRSRQYCDHMKELLDSKKAGKVDIIFEQNGSVIDQISFSRKPTKSKIKLGDLTKLDPLETNVVLQLWGPGGSEVNIYLSYYNWLDCVGTFIAVKGLGKKDKNRLFKKVPKKQRIHSPKFRM